MWSAISTGFCKITELPHGYKYFWGIKLILLAYPTLPQVSRSAIWELYNTWLEATSRGHLNHPRGLRRNQPHLSQLWSLSILVLKPLTMWTPQPLVAPGLQCVSTFIFGKFYVNLHSIAFTYQSITFQYINVYFFLIEIVLAYPVILVIHYFHKRHMYV